jgi:2-iminobutanoate/2-iminopropanoate deaminase
MPTRVQTLTPTGTPIPIGPYSHISKVGENITIGGLAGVDPSNGQLVTHADPRQAVYLQARQILASFQTLLRAAGSDLDHITHVNIYLLDVARDFEAMNNAYIEMMGNHRPARTTIGVVALPKAGALITMSLTAITLHPIQPGNPQH